LAVAAAELACARAPLLWLVATAAHTSAIKPIIVRIGNFSTADRRAALGRE
jgi:hypothetical protein